MTIQAIKEKLKADYPNLRTGNDEQGYVDLSQQEYETTINSWAEKIYLQELEAEEHITAAAKRAAALAKLAALGLDEDDLKALGL